MSLYRTLPFVHHILTKHLHPQSFVIDATIGNGNDTLNAATLLSRSGKIFGFDVQQAALDATHVRLQQENIECAIELSLHSHAQMLPKLAAYIGKIDCVMFNLGYLPHSDEQVTTLLHTTYSAILQALHLLKTRGLLIVVTYPGHEHGIIEHEQLSRLFAQANTTDYFITSYQHVNSKGLPPQVFLVEKRR